jgi:hypothetical protein
MARDNEPVLQDFFPIESDGEYAKFRCAAFQLVFYGEINGRSIYGTENLCFCDCDNPSWNQYPAELLLQREPDYRKERNNGRRSEKKPRNTSQKHESNPTKTRPSVNAGSKPASIAVAAGLLANQVGFIDGGLVDRVLIGEARRNLEE